MYAYNPRKKSFQQLEKSLVGSDRWDILNNILKELNLKGKEKPRQHWMIVGQRGIGKSHLLTLLYYKVRGRRNLSNIWIPVLFPEELRMANSLSKFLERAVNEILLEFDEEKNPISNELKQKIKRIKKVPSSERVDYIFSLISWLHQATGKYILFIAENLQYLLGKKISVLEQKKLRAYLQTSDALLLIGSATTIFNALHDHSHPFYHFFHIRRLGDLSFKDIKTLIVNILSDDKQSDFTKKVFDNEARLKALHSFTGGNPRMAVFISDILKTEVPDEMLSFMDNILDELTPYFEAILNEIPDYLEEIINTLAVFEPAQSPKEIAEHLEVPQTTIRNYLKQLKDNGYVRIAFSEGKSNYYCLNEYLYRIWYQMRDSSHREETRWLMELLLMLYSPSFIIDERIKIDTCANEDKPTLFYKDLIVRTADFISKNTTYCKVIESCVDSISTIEHKKIKHMKEEELFSRVNRYRKNSQYGKAIKICEDFLNINPKFDGAIFLWGICLYEQELYADAIKKLKHAIKINPKSENAYSLWSDCLQEQGLYDEAIEKLKQVIKINPKSEHAYWVWGDCLREQGLYDEAIKKFRRGIKINPKSAPTYGAMGDCFRELGLYEEAGKKYKMAIEVNHEYEDAYTAFGHCLRQQGLYDEAIEKLKQVIKINPKSESAYAVWGACLFKQELYDDAIEKLKHAIKINPKSEKIYLLWSTCLQEQGLYDEAIEKLKQEIKINPKSEVAYVTWGEFLSKQKFCDEAIEKLKHAIKINPKSESAYVAWGECLSKQELYDEAIKKLKHAIKINPKSEHAYVVWGECLWIQKLYDEAIKKLKHAIKINPKSERAYWALAECLAEQNLFNEAINIYENNLFDSKTCQVLFSHGRCLLKQKRYDEALKKYEKLITLKPNCFEAYLSLGQTLENKGNREMAIISYLKYIRYVSNDFSVDYDFQEICKEHILPLLKILNTKHYIRKFYASEEDSVFSRPQLCIFLVLLDKYDVIGEYIQDIISEYMEKDEEDKQDFMLLFFTIKLSIWLMLCEGKIHKATQLVEFYIVYIKSLKTTEEKENEVSNLSLSLFRLYVKMNIEAKDIEIFLNQLEEEDGIPFSNMVFKIWTCLSEPDSVEARRYLNEKAIEEVIKSLKKKDVKIIPPCNEESS